MQNESIWLAHTKGKQYPTLTKETYVDTLIIGGGIVGLTTAYYLSLTTNDVCLVEADELGYGASGRNTGKLTFQHGLIYQDLWKQHGQAGAYAYYKAQQGAIDSIEEIIKEHNIDCDFKRCDALLYTQDEQRISDFQDEYQLYLDLQIPCTFVQESNLPFQIAAGIQVDEQAKYDPYRYLLGLSDILDKAKISIYEHSPVEHIIKDEDSYKVMIHNVCVHAKKIVMATQFPILDHRHFYFARLYPSVTHIATLQSTESIGETMYLREETPLVSYNEMNIHGTTSLLCGGNQHDCGKEDVSVMHSWMDHLKAQFKVSDFDYRWSTQDYLSLDHFPLIGPLDKKEDNIFFASGMQKWGNTNGNVAAKLLCAYCLQQESQYASFFDPHRTNSFLTPKFLQLNFHVMKELLKSYLPTYTNTYPALDEASVLQLHGHTYGMYRDPHDDVYIVDITCPHLGCICTFNKVDKTWDCPCHGSRFTIRGDIIKGPATSCLHAYGDGLNHLDPHIFE